MSLVEWVIGGAIGVGALSGAGVAIGRPVRRMFRFVVAIGRLVETELKPNHGSSLVDVARVGRDEVMAIKPIVAELVERMARQETAMDARYETLDVVRDQIVGFAEDRRFIQTMLQATNERIDKVKDGQDTLASRLTQVESGLAVKVLESHVEVVRAVTSSPPTAPAGDPVSAGRDVKETP